jgi:hypothetical protein
MKQEVAMSSVPDQPPLSCPQCGSGEAVAWYKADVKVLVDDGRITQVVVPDDSAGTCERVVCRRCGYDQPASMVAVPQTSAGRWVGGLLDLLDDTDQGQEWPDWEIERWRP